jgi:hypothetical protein
MERHGRDGIVRASPAPLGTGCPDENYRALGCWVNCGWSVGLGLDGHPEWAELDAPAGEVQGFAQVFVAREARRGRATLRGYLADVHCLGVKNARDPETMDAGSVPSAVRTYYLAFDRPALEIRSSSAAS